MNTSEKIESLLADINESMFDVPFGAKGSVSYYEFKAYNSEAGTPFNAGAVDAKFYMDTLQLEESEYKLIRFPQRGVCLYKCGNERYNLAVHAPAYKEKLFGKAGGR